MRTRHGLAAMVWVAAWCGAAQAGPVLDRVRVTNTIRCGAVERPGLLETRQGGAAGLFVDVCRAVGVAVQGPAVHVDVEALASDLAFDAVRAGASDLVFLSGTEIVEQHLADRLLPGPTVYIEQLAVMVSAASPVRDLRDLTGRPICFEQGTNVHRALEAWAAATAMPIIRMGYQEPDEMHDAFDSRVCDGLAGEATGLAALRRQGGPVTRSARLLPTPLSRFPLIAATGLDDAAWSAVVAWTIDSVMGRDRPAGPWTSGPVAGLPLPAVAPGLTTNWQQHVAAATGSYAAMLARHLGEGSGLRLPAGPNAPAEQGGLQMTPADD